MLLSLLVLLLCLLLSTNAYFGDIIVFVLVRLGDIHGHFRVK